MGAVQKRPLHAMAPSIVDFFCELCASKTLSNLLGE